MRKLMMQEIVDEMSLNYPDLDKKIIKSIIKEGCRNIKEALYDGYDIVLEAPRSSLKVTIFRAAFNYNVINQRKSSCYKASKLKLQREAENDSKSQKRI